jgi:serine phosphatase RsbU (regulator of sigma subunit)
VFLSILDLETGILSYANAGHNPPLISLSGEPYRFMELKKGVPLGIRENAEYTLCALHLNPGDRLYLYTDGVNEAMNNDGEQLGNARFLTKANEARNLDPDQFDETIRRSITAFAEGAEQSDDITTVAIRYVR